MSRRLALSVLSLYPLGFRRRYGAEMRELVEGTPPNAMTVVDLLRGALIAHVRPPASAAALVSASETVRASMSNVLACWVLFAAAGFGFYKTTENFNLAEHAHPVLGDAHLSVQILAVLASGAVLLGASPLILAALRAARRERTLRPLVAAPPLAVLIFAALTAGLILAAHSPHARSAGAAGRGIFIAWELAGLACAAVCVFASRRALFAVSPTRASLLFAITASTLVACAMVVMAGATALYTAALALDDSSLAASANGPLMVLSVSVSLAGQVVVMAAAGAVAALTTVRGCRAARGLARSDQA